LAHNLNDQAVEAHISWTQFMNNTMAGGDIAQRRRYAERALTLARELGQRELLALTLNDIWYAYAGADQWDRALAAFEEGRPITRELGNLAVLSENYGRSAIVHAVGGDYTSALACIDQAYQLAETLHSTDLRALSRAFAGMIHTERGDFDRAIAVSEEVVALGVMTGNVTVPILTRADLGRTYALLGAVAQQALDTSCQFELLAPWPKAMLVRLNVMGGRLDQAEAWMAQLEDYREVHRRVGFMPFMWGHMALAEIEVALARNDAVRAQGLAVELVGSFENGHILFLLPEALLLQGRALHILDQLEAARAALERARDLALKIGSRRLLWPIYAALAQVASQRGVPEAAQALREQAREVVAYLSANAPTAELRASFLAQPEVAQLSR
jgi:tetratricopeptide (TPR) repeat protein